MDLPAPLAPSELHDGWIRICKRVPLAHPGVALPRQHTNGKSPRNEALQLLADHAFQTAQTECADHVFEMLQKVLYL